MKPLTQKPIKRTALGSWLKGKAPHILDTVGDLLPDRGGLGILKNLLEKDEVMSPQDKEQLQIMIAQRTELENEITQRWQADSSSSSWLASNVRPLIVLILVITLLVFIVLDSMDLSFFIRDAWVSLYEVSDPHSCGWILHPALCGGQKDTETMKPISLPSPALLGRSRESFKVSTLLRSAHSASLRHLTEKPYRGLRSSGRCLDVAVKSRYQALPPLGEELHQ